jgi:DNA-binding CsgD family transcriptional regulator
VSIRKSTYLGLEVRLSRSDLEGALDFLREAGDLDGTEPFPPQLLRKLASLVGCQYVAYCEIDRLRGEFTFRSTTHPDDGWPADEAYWATLHEHPIRRHRRHTGELGAFKIYDFVTWRKLRQTQFYSDFLRPVNAGGFLMSICLPAPRGSTRTFNLERDGRDFEERDRTMLDLLQPHLLQIRRATEVRTRTRVAIAAAPAGALTEREIEVLTRVAEGMRNREIAEALWIAPGTVRKHLDNIRAKLGAQTRTEAVRLAQEHGSLASVQNRSLE